MEQNITSITYKGMMGESKDRMEEEYGRLRLSFRYNGTSCVPREPSHGP